MCGNKAETNQFMWVLGTSPAIKVQSCKCFPEFPIRTSNKLQLDNAQLKSNLPRERTGCQASFSAIIRLKLCVSKILKG